MNMCIQGQSFIYARPSLVVLKTITAYQETIRHKGWFTAYLSHVSTSGKQVTLKKARSWNLSSLVVECIVVEELQSSLSPWLRDSRLPDVDASVTWLGRTACFGFSCKDGLDEPSAKGYSKKKITRLINTTQSGNKHLINLQRLLSSKKLNINNKSVSM